MGTIPSEIGLLDGWCECVYLPLGIAGCAVRLLVAWQVSFLSCIWTSLPAELVLNDNMGIGAAGNGLSEFCCQLGSNCLFRLAVVLTNFVPFSLCCSCSWGVSRKQFLNRFNPIWDCQLDFSVCVYFCVVHWLRWLSSLIFFIHTLFLPVYLDLHSNKLSGTIPSELGFMTTLSKLHLFVAVHVHPVVSHHAFASFVGM